MQTVHIQGGVSIALLTTPEEIETLLAFFEKITCEQGWEPGDQLRAYREQSVYFAVFMGAELAGGVQLVWGGEGSDLPCFTVWPEMVIDAIEQAADVAVFAFGQEYRGRLNLFWLLLVEVWRFCHLHGIAELWMEITPRIYRLYQRMGMPVELAGPLRSHWGEECYPCRVGVGALEQAFVEKAHSVPLFASLVAQAFRDRPDVGETLSGCCTLAEERA